PVKNLITGKVEVTTQNPGFAVAEDSIREKFAAVTHRNLNDGTIEGLRFKERAALSVRYHPEASPAPPDSPYLFEEFLVEVDNRRAMPARRGERSTLA